MAIASASQLAPDELQVLSASQIEPAFDNPKLTRRPV